MRAPSFGIRACQQCLLSVAFLATRGAFAQSTAGSIAGGIRDPTGAAVQGAAVTLTALDQNTAASTVTSSTGDYEFLNVRPGRYQVLVEHDDFAMARGAEFRLTTRQTLRVDISLQLPARRDSTRVTARLPLVTTDSPVLSDTKTAEEFARLPLNIRARDTSPIGIISLIPGVQRDASDRISVAGGLPSQTEFTVDGTSNLNNRGVNGNLTMFPSMEAVAEFRVAYASISAEYGQLNDVTLVTKSGTNRPHGALLWYHQNTAFDAKTYGSRAKQAKVFHTFGGALGGPVVVPRLYDGRNRTFFFADYEYNRQPHEVFEQFSVPTAAMRGGNLAGVTGPAARDPSNGLPFPGNVIPLADINSVTTVLLNRYFPLPNATGDQNNYQRLSGRDVTAGVFDLRLDQMIGARQQIFVRWSAKKSDFAIGRRFLPDSLYATPTRLFVSAYTVAIRPNLSNELRFGFSTFHQEEFFPLRGKDVVAELGLRGLDLSSAGDSGGFPYWGLSDAGLTSLIKSRDENTYSLTRQLSNALTWVRGRHTWKFGAETRRLRYRTTIHNGSGADDFGGLEFAANTFSGNAYANFLLGLPAYSYFAALGPNIDEFATHSSFFAQDHWKITPRLTLSYGLRWELHPPVREASGNLSNFLAASGNVVIPGTSLPPAPGFRVGINECPGVAPGGLPCTRILTAPQVGLPDSLRASDLRNWDPRIGFAWQPSDSGKAVLRGGVGIYTQLMLPGGVGFFPSGIHSSDVREFSNENRNGKPDFRLPLISAGGLGQQSAGGEAFTVGIDPTLRDPRIYQWTLTMERELPAGILLRGSYIGSRATGVPAIVNLNQPRASATPFARAVVPYPAFSTVQSIQGVGGNSFHSLLVEGSHRSHSGLFLQASYFLAKNIGVVGNPVPQNSSFPPDFFQRTTSDRYNPRYDRGNLPGSRRNRIVLTTVLPLPFRGAVAGGWQLNAVSILQTGPYLTPYMAFGFDRSNTGVGVMPRPDRIGNGNLEHPTRDGYWDASAFSLVPAGAGRYGTAGAGILRGPGSVALAAGISRVIPLSRRAGLRVEATFTNLLNHPNFASPNPVVTSRDFGRLTTVQSAEFSGNRSGQVGLRLEF